MRRSGGVFVGFAVLFHPGVLLAVVGFGALYLVTHWWVLIFIAVLMVGTVVKAFLDAAYEPPKPKRMTIEQKHEAWHSTKWHTGCHLCDERYPKTAQWFRDLSEDLRRKREAGIPLSTETIFELYGPAPQG